jgi:hypothetical protein
MHKPFTVGIIQDAASDDVALTVEATIPRIREAAKRGAQIVCLKELFNAPYFAKSQKHDRFDIAEPIPGPTTTTMQKIAKELGIVIVVPIFEKQARGVYRNSAAIIDADGSLLGVYRKMHIPDDPLFNEKFYFTPGDAATDDHIDRIGTVAKQASGFRVWHTRFADIGVLICWDQWYPEAARITSLRSAGTRRRSPSSGARRSRRGARCSARTPSPTACTSRPRTASATRTSRTPTESSSSAIPSSPIPSGASSPRRLKSRPSSWRRATRS